VPISLKKVILRRTAVLIPTLLLAVAVALLTSCGDTYRPIAIPILQPGGDPQATHYAIVVNNNNGQPTNLVTGVGPSASQFDVSGDTNMGNRRTGLSPIHAAINTGYQVFVLNQADNTVSTFNLLTSNPTIGTITFEPNAGATYVAAGVGYAFVAETALNRVAVVDTNLQVVKTYINVGASPMTILATPDGKKAYVANTGDGTVTDLSMQDLAPLRSPISLGGIPSGMAIQNSGGYLFVVNSTGGAFSVIDTATDAVVQHFTGLSNPTQVFWDNTLQRVYVVDKGASTIDIYNGAAPQLTLLRQVSLPASPIGLAVLDSGSKFYVLYAGNPGTVGVYDCNSFQLLRTLTVQNTPVSIAAAPGSSKVYVVNQAGDSGSALSQFPNGSISIIKTNDDTVLNVASGAPDPVFVVTK
jgi:YVTN family beta-propeller protein